MDQQGQYETVEEYLSGLTPEEVAAFWAAEGLVERLEEQEAVRNFEAMWRDDRRYQDS